MLLTDKYADKIYGIITCHDRMIMSHAEAIVILNLFPLSTNIAAEEKNWMMSAVRREKRNVLIVVLTFLIPGICLFWKLSAEENT